MVFPLFAAFYYWAPLASRRPLSETMGKTAFWLMFVGVNVTFFTMHLTGLMGMPRRTWTYLPELDWGKPNMISTLGAYVIALGVGVFLVDLALHFRPGRKDAGNVWNAGTLEWLPSALYQTRSIPIVTSREPLWDQEDLADDVKEGRYYLPGTATGRRETIVTSVLSAKPEYVLAVPGPSWAAFLAAIAPAAFFIGLTLKLYVPASACGIAAVLLVLAWMWDSDPGPPPGREFADIGGGLRIPTVMTGPESHSWMATVVLEIVAGVCFACLVFSYVFLWTSQPDRFSPAASPRPDAVIGLAAAALFAVSAVLVIVARREVLRIPGRGRWAISLLLILAAGATGAAVALEATTWIGTGLRPSASSYGAVVFAILAWNGFFAAVLAIMALFVAARSIFGRLTPVRRATLDNTALLWFYGVGQGLMTVGLLHGAPVLLEAGP